MSQDFYKTLNGFSDFKELTGEAHFQSMPDDWYIIITDVKGSTKAIEEGRYKDVNTIGAASIVAAHNAMGPVQFPYVFGGDGATFLIPKSHLESVKKELSSIKVISEKQFNLELRIGYIQIQEVQSNGHKVEVAKFLMSPKIHVAFFKGGGLTYAEEKIKQEYNKYCLVIETKHETDLQQLSCRWKPIPPRHGKILSLLVMAQGGSHSDIYRHIIQYLNHIYDDNLESANPINLSNMSYHGVYASLKNEKRLHLKFWNKKIFKRIIQTIMSVIMFKSGLLKDMTTIKKYSQALVTHSDYRKFDDMLRMTIDCSSKQVEEINAYLNHLYDKKQIYYGIHVSNNSLMTCFVDHMDDGGHIHFIDGGDGGYAMAAKMMKEQMARVD